eukprot:CAMPEP_0177210242 /NCGR_PEP_ID=MMETSP0367-20130122/31448_1 /TAXON_ID=447022 ORGANISM="Scrippsiella hangoei-like, Strain SHHI-4" /NCGR_SAMPLE_ID=MMETSP0367 /ASSEMBLY_ACC=CAM_ASM_000362 /LENGTH=69 /DNA_ID=CAMNT_0018659335 /DNA_START=197 /DNA_END=406 /DNA_ORIENTATION=+
MSSPHLMMATTVAMKPSARATARCLGVKYSFGGALGRNGSIMAAAQKTSPSGATAAKAGLGSSSRELES